MLFYKKTHKRRFLIVLIFIKKLLLLLGDLIELFQIENLLSEKRKKYMKYIVKKRNVIAVALVLFGMNLHAAPAPAQAPIKISFTNEEIQKMSTDALHSLNSNQIKALTPDQINALTPDQKKAFTRDQVRAFTVHQLRAFF